MTQNEEKYDATKALRDAIELKYKITNIIGKGSYGTVS